MNGKWVNIITTLGASEVKIKLTIMNPIELAESRCHDLWKANRVELPFSFRTFNSIMKTFLRSKQIKHFHATLNVPPSRCCRLEFFDVNKFIRARAGGFAGELHNSRSLYCLHCFCKLRSLHSQCCRPLRLCKWKCSDYSLRTSRKSKHVDSVIAD